MARSATQPLKVAHLGLATLGLRHDVIALSVLGHPSAVLAGVLISYLYCFN
jgi:hypothetical protein